MRTALNIDDAILEKACRLNGVKEKTVLVRIGLEALIARWIGQRLAALRGADKWIKQVPRRRSV
ncbi:MAG: type II toxin-antitoxin system VapB family antitoxin [Kiritimatiellae bacterium]|nr:type II toxin-antitoxin system VapB family antitoxin [Kiritimatiellia bacterium]